MSNIYIAYNELANSVEYWSSCNDGMLCQSLHPCVKLIWHPVVDVAAQICSYFEVILWCRRGRISLLIFRIDPRWLHCCGKFSWRSCKICLSWALLAFLACTQLNCQYQKSWVYRKCNYVGFVSLIGRPCFLLRDPDISSHKLFLNHFSG